jgi:hypothetical protein
MLELIPNDLLGIICEELSIRELNSLWAVGNAKLNSNLGHVVVTADDKNTLTPLTNWNQILHVRIKLPLTSNACLSIVARRFPNIRTIRIRTASQLADDCGVEHFSKLQSLHLKHVNLFTDEFIKLIPRSVTSLVIKWSPLITSECYVDLPPSLTKLTLCHRKFTYRSSEILPKTITSLNIPGKRFKLKT